MPVGSPGAYPIPSETIVTSGGASVGGPQYMKFHQYQPLYEDVIDTHVYEDGGASYVSRNPAHQAPIIFLFEYRGNLLEDEVAILDNHRADAFGPLYGFELTNPRTAQVFQDVHYLDWNEDHTLITMNHRIVRLVWRPS